MPLVQVFPLTPKALHQHCALGVEGKTWASGVASVQVVRSDRSVEKSQYCSHNTDILFAFVLKGRLELEVEGYALQHLKQGDAWVMPPGLGSRVVEYAEDLEFLEVALPGEFETVDLLRTI